MFVIGTEWQLCRTGMFCATVGCAVYQASYLWLCCIWLQVIACISTARPDLVETKETLRFAEMARSITNTPVVNREPKDELIHRQTSRQSNMQQHSIPSRQPIDRCPVIGTQITLRRQADCCSRLRHANSQCLERAPASAALLAWHFQGFRLSSSSKGVEHS